MFGVSNYVAKNPETIKILGQRFLHAIKLSVNPNENGVVKHEPVIIPRKRK
jgi:hypothetical protein